MKLLKVFCLCLFIFGLNVAFARVDDYKAELQIIKDMINNGLESYKNGDPQSAKKTTETAYFQHFENIEGTLGRSSGGGRKAFLMEQKFNKLRGFYQAQGDMERTEALVAGLLFDLDEILPMLEGSVRVEAEASDINYDKAKAEKDSVAANAQRSAEADEMFAKFFGDSSSGDTQSSGSTDSADSSTQAQQPTQQAQSSTNTIGATSSAEYQQAAGLNPKLYFLYDKMSGQFDIAAMKFQKGDKEGAAELIAGQTGVLYTDYINTNLSKDAIQKNGGLIDGKPADQVIRGEMRTIGTDIKDGKIDEKALRERLATLQDQIFEALQTFQKPSGSLSQDNITAIIDGIKVEGYDETKMASKDYSKTADDIKISLNNILDDYPDKGSEALIDALQQTYLDIFEGSGMENKIGAVNSDLKLKIEAQFTQGVALIKAQAPKADLQACFDELNRLVTNSLEFIQDTSVWMLFISSLVIILREGMEALLIVIAVMSYLVQSGNQKRANIVYSSLGVGVFLSFVTAFAVYYFFKEYAGQFREILEGATMLIAVLLLLYVGFWLLTKANKWNDMIKGQAQEAISKGSASLLWWTVFLAVYREGAETVLFYQALLFDANTASGFNSVMAGLALGCVILVALYFGMKAGLVRIPIKLFFQVVSVVIFYLCFTFTGKGISELVMGKAITPTLLPKPYNFEPIEWLGLFPYYESIILQAIVVVLIIIGVVLTNRLTSHKGAKM